MSWFFARCHDWVSGSKRTLSRKNRQHQYSPLSCSTNAAVFYFSSSVNEQAITNERARLCVLRSGWKQRLVLWQPKIRGFKWKDNGSCELLFCHYLYTFSFHSVCCKHDEHISVFQLLAIHHSPHHFWQCFASRNGFPWLLWASKWMWANECVCVCALG